MPDGLCKRIRGNALWRRDFYSPDKRWRIQGQSGRPCNRGQTQNPWSSRREGTHRKGCKLLRHLRRALLQEQEDPRVRRWRQCMPGGHVPCEALTGCDGMPQKGQVPRTGIHSKGNGEHRRDKGEAQHDSCLHKRRGRKGEVSHAQGCGDGRRIHTGVRRRVRVRWKRTSDTACSVLQKGRSRLRSHRQDHDDKRTRPFRRG